MAATTRDVLLDAAYDAAASGSWAHTRMADVARVAGVSRQTLYNTFGSKDALAQALALREAGRFLDGTETAMSAYAGGVHDAVAAAVEFALHESADNPLMKAVLTDDTAALLPFITTRAEPIVAEARERIATYFRSHWPELPTRDLDLATEVMVRLTISHMILPTEPVETTASRIAHVVERLLVVDTNGGTP